MPSGKHSKALPLSQRACLPSVLGMEVEAEKKALLTGDDVLRNRRHLHERIMKRERVTKLYVRKEREAYEKRIEAHQMIERQKKAIWDEEAKAIEAQKILNTYKQYEDMQFTNSL